MIFDLSPNVLFGALGERCGFRIIFCAAALSRMYISVHFIIRLEYMSQAG